VDENSLQSRLSRISTVWTLVAGAHRPDAAAQQALLSLVQRYQGAAYRYLLGALRDPDQADELFQEFALRLVRGAFRGADPARGRFRDYLKTALSHLVTDFRRQAGRRPQPLDEQAVQPPAAPEVPASDDAAFLASWREELLARAWAALERSQRRGGPPYYSVLRFRAEHRDADSEAMAARLTEQLRPRQPLTAAGVRKTLQRARAAFAHALLEEVAGSLSDPTYDALEQELIDLGLLSYCRSALAARRDQNDSRTE